MPLERVAPTMSADVAALLQAAELLSQTGEQEAALEAMLAVAKLRPLDPVLRNNIGNLQHQLGDPAAALESYRLASVINPRLAETHFNMGAAQQRMGRLDAAVAGYRKAVSLKPDLVEGHRSLGSVLQALHRYEDALEAYAAALAADPQDAASHSDLAICLLRLGRLEEGFREYEWRWKLEQLRPLPAPLWTGAEDLTGQTILLHSEQGIGDTLQFARFVPLVARRGARIVLGVPQALVPLLQGLEGVTEVSPVLTDLPDFDVQCPLMSLALALGTTLETIPWDGAYIHAPVDRTAAWTARLGPGTRPRIGIAWCGNPLHKNDANRSMALAAMVGALPPGVEVHVLLNKLSAADAAFLADRPDIRFHGEAIGDFADTAALCGLMDGVVSVDTSLAHLAGAMGRPVWILLPHPVDWRWMVNRDDSPWYPTAVLVRQPTQGDWPSALSELSQRLAAAFGQH